jgi:hypothetical protein
MTELTVPPLAEDPFREHYRHLILASLARQAEVRSAEEREHGHRLRAARAEREAARLRAATGASPEPGVVSRRFSRELRSSIRMVWIAALALLAVDIVAFGIDSWTTTVADVGLMALTVVWFWIAAEDLVGPPEPKPAQLELFS